MTRSPSAAASAGVAAFALIASATAIGIAGVDLVLPAVPSLPATLGGTPAVGLLLFGALGARFDARRALVVSLGLYGLTSLAAAFAPTLDALIAVRLAQGAASAAPAVFAPGFIRALFPEHRAVRMMGLLGSVESLVPALAPIAGAALLLAFDWRASFLVIGAAGLALAALLGSVAARLPRLPAPDAGGSYAALLRNRAYLRWALSHAFSLGGLLVFVFGAPAVIVGPMGGRISDFVVLQVAGIIFFIIAANVAGPLAERFGAAPLIRFGTALSAAGAVGILGYALIGGERPAMLIPFSIVVNLGFGLRGPPGFLEAVRAARNDDTRGAALVILAILMTAAAGTAIAAPFVASGLSGLAGVAAAISSAAVACLVALTRQASAMDASGPPIA